MEAAKCILCGTDANRNLHLAPEGLPMYHCTCPRCGDFVYDPLFERHAPQSGDAMVLMSAWVRAQNGAGIVPVKITTEAAQQIMSGRRPRLSDRAMRALAVITRKYPDLQTPEMTEKLVGDLELQALSFCGNDNELFTLLSILFEEGYISSPSDHTGKVRIDMGCLLTVRGLLAAEAVGSSGSSIPQGFVAMSFDNSLREAWVSGFYPAILDAGYNPMRIDAKDYVGGITDEIIAEIRQSQFIVADYTQQKNGVYFEAGFALGLGLPVIPTCRENEIGNLHFDIKHLNTLVWTSPGDLSVGLNKRIRAVLGNGPGITWKPL